jgi:ribosome maturation factor RimP
MILEKIRELAKEIALTNGVELYDVEIKNTDKGKVLRVYLTAKDGVTLADCTRVSRLLNRELDVVDLIASNYFLEVSSPGLERALKSVEHYKQAVGEQVKVTFRQEEKNITVQGTLEEVSSQGILISPEEQKSKKKTTSGQEAVKEEPRLSVLFDQIKKARTVYVFKGKERS